MSTDLTIVTWNLQGSKGVDAELVARTLRECDATVVALQEVHRRQATQVAARLGWNVEWAFKHAPLVTHNEGAAVLSRYPLVDVDVVRLASAPLWSWRRRIALVARCLVPGFALRIASVHLSPHDRAEARFAEAHVLLRYFAQDRAADAAQSLIAGDFNESTPSDVDRLFAERGWHDCWELAPADQRHGDGATNWSPGPRLGRAPDQRLDYVYARPRPAVLRVGVPTESSDTFAVCSDHVPLTVTLGV